MFARSRAAPWSGPQSHELRRVVATEVGLVASAEVGERVALRLRPDRLERIHGRDAADTPGHLPGQPGEPRRQQAGAEGVSHPGRIQLAGLDLRRRDADTG